MAASILDLALASSALLMGLASGPHCAAMCGAAQGGIARACARNVSTTLATAVLQAGRITGYAAAGALLAGGLSWLALAREAEPVLAALWRLAHGAGLGFGLWLLVKGTQPAWLAGAATVPAGPGGEQRVHWTLPRRGPASACAAGLLWVAMPCGLLQSALLGSALASGPAQGAVVMAVFAAGSAASLYGATTVWRRLIALPTPGRWQSLPVRAAGLLLAGSAAWALVMDVGRRAGLAWCL